MQLKILGLHRMNTDSLKIFIDLANSLHYAKTAEAQHMSPSTLSRLIKRMEDDLSCSLFERDNRSVSLTEAGKVFYKFAKQQILDWQQMKLALLARDITLRGQLRLFCSVTAAYSHLPPLLDRFRSIHPAVELIVSTGDPADAIDQLQKNKVDISLAALPDHLPASVIFKCLQHVPLQIIAPTIDCEPKRLLTKSKIEWSKVPYIFPEHGPAKSRLEHWLRGLGIKKPKVYARVAGHEALVSMVALGLGVSIAPQVVIDNSPMQSRVKVLESGNSIRPFEIGVCTLKKHISDPKVAAFMNTADEVEFI